MTQPNEQLIEMIAKLRERFDVRLLDESEINTLFTEVRALLEEKKRLETKYHVDMNNYRSQVQTWQEEHDRQIVTSSQQLQQTREELERLKTLVNADKENLRFTVGLFKAEVFKGREKIESLRTELSAKDKALELLSSYLPGSDGDIIRSILPQYKGEIPNDPT